MCEVESFKNFENSLIVKVMTKTKVAPFYLGHGVDHYNVFVIMIILVNQKIQRVHQGEPDLLTL